MLPKVAASQRHQLQCVPFTGLGAAHSVWSFVDQTLYKQLHPHHTPIKTTEVVLYLSATLQESDYPKKKGRGCESAMCVLNLFQKSTTTCNKLEQFSVPLHQIVVERLRETRAQLTNLTN